jgi:rhomboid family GlyGly-CTERM serine protease
VSLDVIIKMKMDAKQTCYPELYGFMALLIAANATLLLGRVCEPLIFYPDLTIGGDWWRALTFPFVHVSWYHLLLDAGAFLFLYHGLLESSMRRRLLYVAACAAGSLAASLAASPLTHGLCGLSGIAHGLLAIRALELMRTEDRTLRRASMICFWVVILKSILEAFIGHVLFGFLHFGPVGTPVATCHAGGILGGLIVFQCLENKWKKSRSCAGKKIPKSTPCRKHSHVFPFCC